MITGMHAIVFSPAAEKALGGCQASATEIGVKSRPGSPGGSWAP
jgi:hypothetical protein